MAGIRYASFETAIGRCSIAWNDTAIVGVQLPEATEEATDTKLRREHPGAQPGEPHAVAEDAIVRIVSLLNGEPADLDVIPLDVSGASPFYVAVWEATRAIGRGDVLTYGEVARR